MNYQELERRILRKLNVDAEKLPENFKLNPDAEYAITYCVVQALVEYDKMRTELKTDDAQVCDDNR